MKRILIVAVAMLMLQFPVPAVSNDSTPEYYPIPGRADLPLSEAVRVGDLLFLSGKLGNMPGTMTLPAGIAAQTRQTMENIKNTLVRLGSSMDRVVKCTVFLADIAEWAAMNEVYRTYFPTNPPARSAVGVSGIALDGRVEIECIAAASGSS